MEEERDLELLGCALFLEVQELGDEGCEGLAGCFFTDEIEAWGRLLAVLFAHIDKKGGNLPAIHSGHFFLNSRHSANAALTLSFGKLLGVQ